VSAAQGYGIGDFLEHVVSLLPEGGEPEPAGTRVAIVGRPNVGKSSLVNAFLGSERVIVSEMAGTTRDAIDTRLEVDGRPVELTATEFSLLAAMAREPGRVFTRSQLLDAVHGMAIESYERAIDAHVKNIRRKIEPDPRHPRHLLTVYGVGYRLADA
jgi:small GTP-binding protein